MKQPSIISNLIAGTFQSLASLGWLWTIEGSMAALGSALGGWVAEAISPQFCLGVTTLMLAIGFAILNIGRRRFAAADVVLEG